MLLANVKCIYIYSDDRKTTDPQVQFCSIAAIHGQRIPKDLDGYDDIFNFDAERSAGERDASMALVRMDVRASLGIKW